MPAPGSLADVLPAAAVAVGLPAGAALPGLRFPPARVVLVVLVDGLGELALARRGGHAPFLRSLREAGVAAGTGVLAVGFPSTTATSMGSLGTGLSPGVHGLVGTDVLDPARDAVFSELGWDPAVDPRAWQPEPTVFERVVAAGLDVVRIGPGYFNGSGLTEAALRGGAFLAAESLPDRIAAGLAAAGSIRSGLIYLYWGELDKIGHTRGVGSWAWTAELESIDRAVRQLAEGLSSDVLLVVTADHGMVDVPFGDRLDVAAEPDLAAGVRYVGGEARALHLYCEPGAAAGVAAAWQARLEPRMTVLLRDEAIAAGWFGAVAPRVLPRIGDVVTSAVDGVAVVDSRTARPELLRLIGLHGARTDEETLVPLLVTRGLARH